MTTMRSVLLLTALSLASAMSARAVETGLFHNDSAHSGVFVGTDGNSFAGMQWRFGTGGTVRSSPVVSNGVLYIGSSDGYLYAIDANSGAQRWKFDSGAPIVSSAAISGDTVYVENKVGTLYALDASSATQRWVVTSAPFLPQEWTHDNFNTWSSSPNISSGLVIYGSGDGFLRAVDARTGTQKWQLPTAGQIQSSPAVAGSTVFVTSTDGLLYAADLKTGALKWKYATQASQQASKTCGYECHSIHSSPAVVGTTVVFGARDGFLYSVNSETGALIWRVDHKTSWVNDTPAVDRDTVYDCTADSHLIEAIDASTGTVRWRFKGESLMFASVAIAGEVLYEVDYAGNLLALNRRTGGLLWKHAGTRSLIASSPWIAGDRIYFGSDDGFVYALNLSKDKPLLRAVYWDASATLTESYTKAASGRSPEDLRDYLEARGYSVLNQDELREFLTARLRDGAPSVVVFAADYLPTSPPGDMVDLFQHYLKHGGKVVWSGFPPLLWAKDPKTGKIIGHLKTKAAQDYLGVTYHSVFTPIDARVTKDGLQWGLRDPEITLVEVDPKSVSVVLALGEDGYAGSWVRRSNGNGIRVSAAIWV